jgi:hypothetical protein
VSTPTEPPEHTPAELVAAIFEARLAGDDAAADALLRLAPPDDDDEAP